MIRTEAEEAYNTTIGLMNLTEGLPLDWKPSTGNNWLTTGQLLHHLTEACGGIIRGFVTGDWGVECDEAQDVDYASLSIEQMLPPAEKFPTVQTVAEALEKIRADRAMLWKLLDETDEQRLATEPAPAPWDPRPMVLGQRCLQSVHHLLTHKAQLFYYLKLQGKPVNTIHLWMGAPAGVE